MKVVVRSIMLGSLALLAACSSGLEAPLPQLTAQETSTTLSIPVLSASDDAEEIQGGAMQLTGGLLDLRAKDGVLQTVGVRFQNVAIPRGATIESAYFTVKGGAADSGSITLKVQGEASDNALTFSTAKNNLGSRGKTSAAVSWQPASWAAGKPYQTGNIASVVQEIVSRSGWQSGNSLALFVSGAGGTAERAAIAYGSDLSKVPVLVVTFRGGTTTPPTPEPEPEPPVPAGSSTVSLKVNSALDDLEELSSGSVTTGLALDFTQSQKVGLRFSGVTIPQGATITAASLSLSALVTEATLVSLNLRAEAADNALALSTTTKNLSSRVLTIASSTWQPSAWTVGGSYRSGDIKSVVQEVVSRSGWQSGNAIALIVSGIGSGKRAAAAWDKDASRAPTLSVSYTVPPTPEPDPEPEPEPNPPTGPSVEQQLWLARLRSSLDSGRYQATTQPEALNLDKIAASANAFKIARNGKMVATSYVLAYRATGDRVLIDHVNRFMLGVKDQLQDHNSDGFRDLLINKPGDAYHGLDTGHNEEMLLHGTLAGLALALEDSGYNDTAAWFTSYFKNDFLAKWAVRGYPEGPRHPLTHPSISWLRFQYAMYKLTGESKYLTKAKSMAATLEKTIREDGWSHYFGQTSGCAPSVYVPLTISDMVDLATNGSGLIDTATLQRAAKTVATKVMIDSNGTVLAGNNCGESTYGGMASIYTFTYTPIGAWDDSGYIEAVSERVYNATERYNLTTPINTVLPASLTFTLGK